MNKFHTGRLNKGLLRGRLGLSKDAGLQLGLAKAGTSTPDDQLLFNFRMLTLMDRITLALWSVARACSQPSKMFTHARRKPATGQRS